MRIIYFSPHLDDAVLSAGGLIRSQVDAGIPVEIWTFMAGIPGDSALSEFAKKMHGKWGFNSGQQAVESRRLEDREATAQVGAKCVQFDFLDCLYRCDRLGRPMYSDVELPIHSDDVDLAAQIAQTMIAWVDPDDTLVCQLAVGGHVDHVIVRQAAEMLRRPLTYDVDLPYLLDHPEELEPSTFGLRESLQPISEPSFRCWITAIECYRSQIGAVFGSHELMHQRMHDFWLDQRGIQFWTRQTSG